MAVRLEIQISATGAAFEEWPQYEARRALEQIGAMIERDVTGTHPVKDSNGNTVGEWSYDPYHES